MKQSLLNRPEPGVYVFWRGEERIYVGSTVDLNGRRPSKRDKGHESRFAAIMQADRTELIPCESATKARQLEERLIRTHKPAFNLRTPRAEADLERTAQIIRNNL